MSFDTRRKILSLDQARDMAPPAVVVVTHLEVLQQSHIQELVELARAHPGTLALVLTDPESPLVPLEARAEVAAGLRLVDYVIPSPGGAAAALAALGVTAGVSLVVEDEEKDRARTRRLMEHVQNRCRI